MRHRHRHVPGHRSEYAFSATADGQVIVSHAIEDQIDGTDSLRNIEKVQFADGTAASSWHAFNDHRRGTPRQRRLSTARHRTTLSWALPAPTRLMALPATTSSSAVPRHYDNDVDSTYADNFNNNSFGNSNGTTNWDPDWVETNDSGGVTQARSALTMATMCCASIGGDGAHERRRNHAGSQSLGRVDGHASRYRLSTPTTSMRSEYRSRAVRGQWRRLSMLLSTIDANDTGSWQPHCVNGPFSRGRRVSASK